MNFSGRTAGTLAFDYAQVSNSTGSRPGGLKVYYSTDGTAYTEISAAAITVINNVASSGTISVALPKALDNVSTARIRFYNYPASGGGSNNRPKIAVDNISVTSTATDVASIISLDPSTTVAGSSGFTLTLTGTGFASNAIAYFNGAALTTTYVSATQLTASVPASAVATTGTFPVTVKNGSTGTDSNVLNFTVTAVASNTVTTTAIAATTYCVGSTGAAVSVPFTSSGTFSGNTYTAYLGTTSIGSVISDANAGTINAVIPASVASGAAYRIRVDASSPATTGSDNGANLTVVNYQTNEVTSFTATAGNAQAGLSWSVPASCFTQTVIVASPASITATPSGAFTANAAYGTGSDLGNGQFVVYAGAGTSATVMGLTNGTAYFFKAFTTNGDGYSTGVQTSATPFVPQPAPTTFTPPVGPVGTVITISGANLSTITGVTVGGTPATNVSATATAVTATVAAGSASGAVVLSDGTTTYSATGSFTVTTAPVVTTAAVTNISFSSATSGGSVTSPGATVTARGVVYSTSPNPRIGGSGVTQVTSSANTGNFTSTLTGLTGTTTYYVAAYATNNVGISYGADEAFTTAAGPLLGYNFQAATNPENPSTVGSNVSGSAFKRSPGLSDTSNDDFRASNFPFTAPLADTTKGYFEFRLTVATGFEAVPTTLTLQDRASGTGPQTWELRTSLNNFNATVGAIQNSSSAYGTTKTVSLTSLGAFSGTVVFRIYAYGASGSGGTFGVDNVSLFGTTQIVGNTISAPAVTGSAFCAGATFNATFTPTGSFGAANSFIAQLSDASGVFSATPTEVGRLDNNSGTTAQTIAITVPGATTSGTGYKLRIISTDPRITGLASGAFAVVNNPMVSVTPAADQSIGIGVNGTTLTATETPAATSRQWYFALSPGGAATAINGATGLTYTPNFASAGEYYVKAVSTFAACGLVTSNEVKITVAAATPTLTAATSPATSPTAISGLATAEGTPSTAKTYTLTGSNLDATPVTVTAPAGFQVSTTAAFTGITTDANTLNLTPAGGSLNQVVYVRLTGTTAGSFSGSVTNSNGSLSAPVLVSGAVSGVVVSRWDGGGDGTSFADARNWTTDQVPTTGEDVLLDHSFVSGAYTMTLPAVTSGTLSLGSLTINPNGGASITALLPNSNTAQDYLRFTKATNALVIYNGGVFINNSGASSGGSGNSVDVTPNGQNFIIYNGGTYVHRTPRGVGALLDNLSTVSGTETGLVQFDVPSGSSYSIPSTGRTYGSLSLSYPATSTPPASGFFPYLTSGTSPFVVRGNLTMAANVSFTVELNSDMSVRGNLLNAGRFKFAPANLTNARRLILNGTTPQTISGTPLTQSNTGTSFLGLNVILQINNPAGVTLATGVVLNSLGNANSGGLELLNGVLSTSGSAMLKLAADAVLLPAQPSAASYVNGPLQREIQPTPTTAVVADYLFPIGQNGKYRPLTLNVASLDALTTFTATQNDAAFPDRRLTGDLARVSRVRYFSVVPTVVPATFSGTITLSFGADDEVTNPALSSFVIGKNSGNGWENIGRSANTSTTLTSGTFTSFSDFALASTDPSMADNPLPVSLTSFTAQRQPAGIVIRWTTASELNNARFEVQRSLNGREFATIAVVAGQGQSSRWRQYSVLDQQPAPGLAYYRLRQVDLDGKTSYSAVAVVDGLAELQLYPNPVRHTLTIQGATASQPLQVSITDLTGRPVWSGACAPGGSIDMQRFPQGTYLVRILENGRASTHKITRAD
ncbi:T9SS type A sorting domain-containing protein [Hymenobacter cellulosivorans]|uniref:T9SS type A sorting domain-containing protein n=1 Tax=Hymenobacter cellulosivorans TaxID=2932249 RepID=A0ABY4F6X0_9BACT|nr:T9SS type A sorting domain-containing protein [Hymenobacter cellulosivorans]UOQ52419.1 T9SS type A sorting domain-containing protein [Hymenobacter cellulosivorans]